MIRCPQCGVKLHPDNLVAPWYNAEKSSHTCEACYEKRERLKKEYKKACDAFSHANLTGQPLSELQAKRERLRYLVYG